MLLGEHKQAIDEKGGLLLPSQYSVLLASGIVVTRGFERNLMLFPHDGWQLFAHKVLNQPLSFRNSRALRRRLFSNAAVLNIDPYGRIHIPSALRDFAELQGEVVLAGMYDYLEIWDIRHWLPEQEAANSRDNGSIWETVGV